MKKKIKDLTKTDISCLATIICQKGTGYDWHNDYTGKTMFKNSYRLKDYDETHSIRFPEEVEDLTETEFNLLKEYLR